MLGVQISESSIQTPECYYVGGSDSYTHAVMPVATQLSVHILALTITNVCNAWRNIWNIEGASYMHYVVQTVAGQNRIFVRYNQPGACIDDTLR